MVRLRVRADQGRGAENTTHKLHTCAQDRITFSAHHPFKRHAVTHLGTEELVDRFFECEVVVECLLTALPEECHSRADPGAGW